jgi:hypothetical protein
MNVTGIGVGIPPEPPLHISASSYYTINSFTKRFILTTSTVVSSSVVVWFSVVV